MLAQRVNFTTLCVENSEFSCRHESRVELPGQNSKTYFVQNQRNCPHTENLASLPRVLDKTARTAFFSTNHEPFVLLSRIL